MAIPKKKKMSLPPKPLDNSEDMQKMINKGGSATVVSDLPKDELKSFTIKIYESELAKIRTIIGRESKRDRVSIRTFITDAVLSKIEDEY